MADMPIIEARARADAGKGAARQTRRDGYVPAVIYGGGKAPETIAIKDNVLMRHLKAGKFKSTLLNVKVDGKDNRVICREVQRDVVKDLPIHADFLRLSERSRINLYIPVEFVGHETCPGLRAGGVVTVVRQEVELKVTAGDIPEKLVANLSGKKIGDVITISQIELPKGTTPTITGRDFVIANIAAPAGLLAAGEEDEEAETEEEAEEA